jgi:hypothetical protein
MRRTAVILTAAATVAAGLLAVPAQAATLPSPAATGYAFFTAPRVGTDWGTSFQATTGLTGSSVAGGGLTVSGTAGAAGVGSTTLTPPTGGAFAVGTFPIKQTASATEAGVSITGSTVPAECAVATSGTLTVHEVTLAAGAVTAFAGSVRGTCGSGAPGIGVAQEVRFNSTVPTIVLSAPVSTPKSEVVTVQVGATDTTFGTPVGTGADAKVAVTANTCTGLKLAGTTCDVTVTATPDFFGPAQDVITLPDGSADGRKIPVTAFGFDTATGAYTPLAPTRLLDTRSALGVTTRTPVGAGQVINLQVTGRGGVPAAGATAVVLNITVVGPTAGGFVTLYPTGAARPTASSVNFNAGFTGANLVTVTLGTGGKVSIYNKAGNTHVLADVMGYYHGATSTAATGYGGYSAIEPTRMLDSRDPLAGALPPGAWYTTGLDFGGPDVNSHIKGYAVNVTATGTVGSGFFTAWNGDGNAIPNTSTLNFTRGKTVPNMAIVPTSACGVDCGPGGESIPIIGVRNRSNGNADVIVDLVGVYDDNTLDGMWRFRPLASPTRIVNTTTGQGIPAALGVGGVATVTDTAAVTTFNSTALVTNTTANKPTRNTVLTLWNPDFLKPTVSNLNPAAGQLVSNMTITDIGAAYDFTVGNTSGSTNLVIDVAGTMETYPAVADPGTGAALRAKGLSALRKDSAVRATGDPKATAPTLHGTPFRSTAQHR